MEKSVELLSAPANYAVVQLPERRFPGVVVQGDGLHELVRDLGVMMRLLKSGKLDELAAEIGSVKEQLSGVLAHYEKTCAARGIDLPYAKP